MELDHKNDLITISIDVKIDNTIGLDETVKKQMEEKLSILFMSICESSFQKVMEQLEEEKS